MGVYPTCNRVAFLVTMSHNPHILQVVYPPFSYKLFSEVVKLNIHDKQRDNISHMSLDTQRIKDISKKILELFVLVRRKSRKKKQQKCEKKRTTRKSHFYIQPPLLSAATTDMPHQRHLMEIS